MQTTVNPQRVISDIIIRIFSEFKETILQILISQSTKHTKIWELKISTIVRNDGNEKHGRLYKKFIKRLRSSMIKRKFLGNSRMGK